MRIFIQLDNNRVQLRSPYHVKLKDLYFSIQGYTYDADQQVHSFPIEAKAMLVESILALNVSLVEVKELGVLPPLAKIASYKIKNDTMEVLASYSTKVLVQLLLNTLYT